MDLTLYLFNSRRKLRAIITQGIVQLIHKERARTLSAEISTTYSAEPGEHIGFRCVDGRCRLFAIEYADRDDNTATTIITATDAAKDALTGAVVSATEQESAGIAQATGEMLAQIGWTIGRDETEGKTAPVEGGLRSAWAVIEDMETAGNLYAEPYYEFDGKEITGKVVDLMAKRPVYRGRFVQRGTDAENIVITKKNRPRPMIFGVGADGLTLAGVEWSTEKGDPVDKPAGQLWIGVPEAVERYPEQGQVYEVATSDITELINKSWEKAQQAAQPGVTATATISDMEMAAGQTWKAVRIWDLVRVRPRYGEDVEAQVIEIARNYVRPDETKITLGEEPDSSTKAIRALTKTTAANVRSLEKYQAEFKDMLVTVEELDEYTRTTITEAWIELEASTDRSFAQIGSRLDSTDAKNDEQFRTISESMLTLENDLERATAELAASVAKIEDGELKRLSEAVLDLDANLDSATASMTARLDENEAQILLTATELGTRIDLKADVTYVQRMLADEIEAAIADISATFADSVSTEYLVASTYATFNCPISYQGDTVIKRTGSVITNISGSTATVQEYEILTTGTGDSYTLELGSVSDSRIEELIQEALEDLSFISALELNVDGDTTIGGRMTVGSITNINGRLYANSGIQVTGNTDVSGSMTAAAVDTDILRFKDNTISLKTATFLTSATSIQVVASGGVVTNVEFNRRTANISYLSWEESED